MSPRRERVCPAMKGACECPGAAETRFTKAAKWGKLPAR
jgi:hypothetical protein